MLTDNQLYILSLNVRGMSVYNKRKLLYDYFREHHADIVMVQESHNCVQTNANWEVEYRGRIFYSYGKTNARGVSTFISKKLLGKLSNINTKTDTEGLMLIMTFQLENETYTLANIYGPNKDSPGFFQELENLLSDNITDHTIIGGDFNLVMDENLDCKNRIDGQPQARKILKSCMEKAKLVDIWRAFNPKSENTLGSN